MAKFKQKVLDLAESRVVALSHITIIDRIIKKLFLGLIPKFVTPNQITVFRFVSIPLLSFYNSKKQKDLNSDATKEKICWITKEYWS